MATNRRHFLKSAAIAPGAEFLSRAVAANDRIGVATIGFGGKGMGDTRAFLALPGVQLVGACDLYDGRLLRAREIYGRDLLTTRDYRELLARKDVDVVIIATSDNWHSRITIDALRAGKDVYCEKPMVQKLSQGQAVIAAQNQSGRILQVGSQYVSSLAFQKVRDLLAAGAIGELNMVEGWLDRNTALGACQYTIPPDASEQSVDWSRFLGDAPARPFDPLRFFRWRNYRDYGTGVAGDTFVHLLSGLHMMTASAGPTRVFATGGLRYWKDGRDVPDVMLALFDYPATSHMTAFNLMLRVNHKSGLPTERFGYRFLGSEGTLTTSGSTVTLSKAAKEREPGYTISTFPAALQEKFLAGYRSEYPPAEPAPARMPSDLETAYSVPAGYNPHTEHVKNFHLALRSRKPFLEDGAYGFRAAAPALLCNTSFFEQRACHWDPTRMTEGHP
jgi:predicted dehydrogenase